MLTRVIRTSKNTSVYSSLLRFNTISSTVSPEVKTTLTDSDIDENVQIKRYDSKRNKIIEAAFASLQVQRKELGIKTPFTDDKLEKASDINQLLAISEGSGVSRKHALKVVSILSTWSSSGKVQLTDFENDPRFLRLCRVLTKVPNKVKSAQVGSSEDLSTVLSVAADEEAAHLIGSITVPQMVKVMKTLSMKKRRSTLLLRTLSFNITRSSYQLNIKEASDLLYSMSILNFPDENLMTRIANDICIQLQKKIERSSVMGSILTSIGLMRYHNPVLLDSLSDWILNNHSICRNQDIYNLYMTLAVVNFLPTNADKLFEVLSTHLSEAEEGSRHTLWLEIVWSLLLLNKATTKQISSILCENFLSKYQENSSFSCKLKLLNIDAAAQFLIQDYNGPRLPQDSVVKNVKPVVSKDKKEMIDSVVSTLGNLIKSEELLKMNIDTGMGFYIDAECLLDKKCCPVPIKNVHTGRDLTRVAVIVQDYHDMTVGKVHPTGRSLLSEKLLQIQGYKILTVPYTEFKPKDNLIQRVKYIETKLKSIVNS